MLVVAASLGVEVRDVRQEEGALEGATTPATTHGLLSFLQPRKPNPFVNWSKENNDNKSGLWLKLDY